mmetsp:Transcript_75465/g.216081  ORF Transcript_75465/g.216081 Transcript_75465/m.216081 type:complete len:226 (+) Transcript_75465:1053-1730(+)
MTFATEPTAVTRKGVAPSLLARQKVVPMLMRRSMGMPGERSTRYSLAATSISPGGAPPRVRQTVQENVERIRARTVPRQPAKISACERSLLASAVSPFAKAAPSSVRLAVFTNVVTYETQSKLVAPEPMAASCVEEMRPTKALSTAVMDWFAATRPQAGMTNRMISPCNFNLCCRAMQFGSSTGSHTSCSSSSSSFWPLSERSSPTTKLLLSCAMRKKVSCRCCV